MDPLHRIVKLVQVEGNWWMGNVNAMPDPSKTISANAFVNQIHLNLFLEMFNCSSGQFLETSSGQC